LGEMGREEDGSKRLSRSDAAHVRRLRDLLERYRPSARPVADEFIHELNEVVSAEVSLAMRPVRGELGWSVDFLYCTRDLSAFRNFIATAQDGWTPWFPVTPEPLRNLAVRPKVLHQHLTRNPPSTAYAEMLALAERVDAGLSKDDLAVSLWDGDVALGWFASARAAPFGPRELALLDALIPSLRARMLLEHQLGHAHATLAVLEAALDAIPTAAFFLMGAAIAHANATGRLLLERDRAGVVDMLRESMQSRSAAGPFTITHVEARGMQAAALAVLRANGAAPDLHRRLGEFRARYSLTSRQIEVLALLARGYGNKTIAERIGVAEATVEEHVTRLFRKVGVDSRAELVARFWTE
jgi:DNA-binding CsgD family transcriptional regulator